MSSATEGGDDAPDWEGMTIGFCIVGALLALDAVLFIFVFELPRARRLLTEGVRVPATSVTYNYKGDREYDIAVTYNFKGVKTAEYRKILQSTVDELKKKAPREHHVLVHPRNDADNMLAGVADEIGEHAGLCAYFATIGFGFLMAGVIAAAHTPEHLDADGQPDATMMAVAIVICSLIIVAYFVLLADVLRVRARSRTRVVSGVLNNESTAAAEHDTAEPHSGAGGAPSGSPLAGASGSGAEPSLPPGVLRVNNASSTHLSVDSV